ncbi:MAG: D-glycerate dehydrogenase [Planctomycetes bacterium]|nr:D-glycerate dehydrogenase [Planctomycetota bacterium]
MSAVLVTRALPPGPVERLAASGLVTDLRLHRDDRPMSRAELLAAAAGCRALLTQLVDRVDEELLAAAGPGLALVANYAVGLDNVDVAACTARGVLVSNTPGVLTEATADLTWALLLAVTRRVVEGDRLMRRGGYRSWSPTFLLGHGVTGKTLGVVGLGRIGAAVARRARAFGMKVVYASPAPKPVAAEVAAEHVALERLLGEADVVSLHCPLRPDTRHLIDAARLQAMKPTAFLINTARGPLVDEPALVRALEAGWIAGAGLDVTEREPLFEPGLAARDDVVLLPHVGSATHEVRTAMGDLAVDNVLDLLEGRPPRTCVNLPGARDGR